jgi:hypothetical protein
MITPNRTWHACVGGDDGVPFRRKKRVQELVCCFHLCQLMLFKIIVVGPIMEWLAQRYCIKNLWWDDPNKNMFLMNGNF